MPRAAALMAPSLACCAARTPPPSSQADLVLVGGRVFVSDDAGNDRVVYEAR